MTQSQSAAGEVRRLITEIRKFDVERDLVRTASLGDWAFTELRNEFNQLKILLTKLEIIEIKSIHLPTLHALSRELTNLLTTLLSIVKFGVAQDRAEQSKNVIINNFHEVFDKVLNLSVKAFQMLDLTTEGTLGAPHYGAPQVTVPTIESENLEREIKEAEEKLKTTLGEMESVLAAVRAKSKEVGVDRYSVIFNTESTRNSNSSIVWLVLTAILLATGVAYGFSLNNGLENLAEDIAKSKLLDNNNYVLQITIVRLLTITILFYAIAICMKNYRAQKHNQVINRHRHNALITFETFNAGATDEGTKNAVLLEATRAIFGNQPTGFGSKDGDVESPTNQVIEILKTRTDGKTSSV
ncbi:hypothetical protein KK083_03445 [Fulvivirgaceae bacterium PWU4]|uniref:Uncharacterized protein n=1 Tax=Chryseosolibacter histidini TaxID=2782349 RepID=A0AAP2GHD2_9BACT|nr:hypothetical protein [Chryseosolibacter histidini]MBT1695916.1 hypothetical protein [Chryseosolibacter histidini]